MGHSGMLDQRRVRPEEGGHGGAEGMMQFCRWKKWDRSKHPENSE